LPKDETISKSAGINILFKGERYELLEDKSISYFDKNDKYVGDIVLRDNSMNVQDKSSSTGEIIITNPTTNEVITLDNIRQNGNITLFDAKTSNGLVFTDLQESSKNDIVKTPIIPIIRAIEVIVAVIVVAVSSGGTQNDCMKSMPKNCPPGYAPYAEYESGWFTSSCSVGCRK
jgi:hypothetical protein